MRQGPHQLAVKSTRTGLSDCNTSASKFPSLTATTLSPAISSSPSNRTPATGSATGFENRTRSNVDTSGLTVNPNARPRHRPAPPLLRSGVARQARRTPVRAAIYPAEATRATFPIRPLEVEVFMGTNRVFFPQEAMDEWMVEERVTIEDDVMTLMPGERRFKLVSALPTGYGASENCDNAYQGDCFDSQPIELFNIQHPVTVEVAHISERFHDQDKYLANAGNKIDGVASE